MLLLSVSYILGIFRIPIKFFFGNATRLCLLYNYIQHVGSILISIHYVSSIPKTQKFIDFTNHTIFLSHDTKNIYLSSDNENLINEPKINCLILLICIIGCSCNESCYCNTIIVCNQYMINKSFRQSVIMKYYHYNQKNEIDCY